MEFPGGRLQLQLLPHVAKVVAAGARSKPLRRADGALREAATGERLVGEDVETKIFPGNSIGRVRVDPGSIEQVVMNLAVNARDAMPRGGKLTVETANVFLDKAYAREHLGVVPGPYVMLAVSDNGVGNGAMIPLYANRRR